jgi:hypothetical protein
VVYSKVVIPPVAALLEKTIIASKQRPPRLVTPLIAALQTAVTSRTEESAVPDK